MGNIISYSAVVLNENSKRRLINWFGSYIPNNFEIIADHMTINLGNIDSNYEKYLGMTVRLIVNEIGINDDVIAVGVSGFFSTNIKPHVTLAVNRLNGGTPKLSKNIKQWKTLKRPIFISGVVSEVELNL